MIDSNTLNLIKPTDQLLNEVAKEVSPEDISSDFIQGVIKRMAEIASGKGHDKDDTRQMVGLAAPQIGVSLRIFLLNPDAYDSTKPHEIQAFINPTVIERSETFIPGREGCWSCGNICGNVDRSDYIAIEAYNPQGIKENYNFKDFVARIVQHEIDHLDGIRFPDRIPENQPERLHWVEPHEFTDYREKWQNWPNICPREEWDKMKSGIKN